MKNLLLTLFACLVASVAFAGNQLTESFEYGNHDLEKPVGWSCDDGTWLCGYQEKDHNRLPHTGNWYAFTEADDAWMYMPLSLFERLQYRFYCWAVSDGSFTLELWAGTAPEVAAMHTLLLEGEVDGGVYEQFYSYVETIAPHSDYIGVHAVKNAAGSFLTIDDIEIDMVSQYDFISGEMTSDTAMFPGTEGVFRFWVKNTGYDPLDITAHPSNEFFTNLSCIINGATGFTFHLEPEESVEVTAIGTLRPEIQPGTTAWLDIMMTIPCGCNTSMVTFWVTPLDVTQTAENALNVSVFPNPASDYVTVEAEGLEEVIIFDLRGRVMMEEHTKGCTRIKLDKLMCGLYTIVAKTHEGYIKRTFVKH